MPIYVKRWRPHAGSNPRLLDVLLLAVALIVLAVWGLVAGVAAILDWLSRPRCAWAWSRIPRARVVPRVRQ